MGDIVRLLEDREAIAAVVTTYARGVDHRDFEAVRGCFAPDLHVVAWGPGDMDRDETIAYISGVAIFRETMHMMGNQVLHVDGDRATALTQALLAHDHDSWDELLVESPRYVEVLERRAGGWQIVERGGAPVAGLPRLPDSDDPALRWLLDRAAIVDLLAVEAFTPGGPVRFSGSRLVRLDADEARVWSVALTVEPRTDRHFVAPSAEAEPTVDVVARTSDGWRHVERRAAREAPDAPIVPTSDDRRVQGLLDRAAVRDAVVAFGWHEGTTVTNNHRVAIEGDGATVESYAYRPPDWATSPERWVDRLERRDGRWSVVEHRVASNRMPDAEVRPPA
jgi:ketosteroid isomerase-like protein